MGIADLKQLDLTKYILTTTLLLFFLTVSCHKNPTGSDTVTSFEWPVAQPESQGFDAQVLATAFTEAGKAKFINSLVIVRNGYLVAEKYNNGHDRNDYDNVQSVSKSFVSALVGIAMRENFISSLDQKMLDFFPEYASRYLDKRTYDITIKDLLTMKAGFDHDQNILFLIFGSANWMKALIEHPLKYNPGEKFCYSTPGSHLLSGIITKATGMNTLDFAKRYLFEPLKISIHDWRKDPQDYYFGGSDMYFTPRDMARFGNLYLNDGLLDNRQIVPQQWVKNSLRNDTYVANSSWGALQNYGYGYLWWLGTLSRYQVFLALGHGGQYIICIPQINLVIVTTSNSNNLDWDQADSQERAILDIIANNILPAVLN